MSSSPSTTRTLRSRKSKQDSRVEMIEFGDAALQPESDRTPSPSPPSRSPKRVRISKDEEGDNEDAEEIEVKKVKKSSPTKHRPALEKALAPPKRWEECYNIILAQRKSIVAPVDSMGCDDAGKQEDEAERPDNDERSRRYRTLVSLMLSSQTKDPVTSQATSNLRQKLPGGLTLESILAASDEDISSCINKVGFWRRKTEYIKKAAQMMSENGGDVPQTIDGLLALPGVGPKLEKMGYLALQSCWNINAGIGVDTHVHRITNRLGWHKKHTMDAEQTRVNLESWLPKELHRSINHQLVGFGQVICLPIGPRCDLCDVAKVPGLCPSKQRVTPRKISKAKAEELEAEAKVKIEIEPALIDDKLVQGEVLETLDRGQKLEEIRMVKSEGTEEILEVTREAEGEQPSRDNV